MEEITTAITAACQELFDTSVAIELTRPEEQFGDYATNVALQLSKQLGKNPREIAEALAERVKTELGGSVQDVTVAGPGFLNLTLTDDSLWKQMKRQPQRTLAGQNILVEYSDPNVMKVLHAGHLYTTITGDVIAHLLEAAGATVHRLNYGGDVGRHVGMSMWAIIQELGGEHPEKLADIPETERMEWLSARYIAGNNAFADDETAKAAIIDCNKHVYELHNDNDHDSPFAQIYWTCRAWSYEGFKKLYEQLEVTAFERYIPESEVTPTGLELVKRGLAEGVFKESDGAVVFVGEEFSLHTRVFINSNGLPTYEAKDMGLAATKWNDYHFDQSIIITANDILEYMKVVLKALEHFYPEIVARSRHLTHGNVKLPGGLKMSSRTGNILRAVDILEAAEQANHELTGKDSPETVLGAVKYAFLKNRIGSDMIYDPAESVSLEGNSGPYLQYAHARARSILRKQAEAGQSLKENSTTDLQPGERSLARKLSEYSEVVDRSIHELMSHHICTYLYELSQVFNRFYEHNHVVGDDREALRTRLVTTYADTLRSGLALLGIASPDKM